MELHCAVPVLRTMIWDLSLGAGERARAGLQAEPLRTGLLYLGHFQQILGFIQGETSSERQEDMGKVTLRGKGPDYGGGSVAKKQGMKRVMGLDGLDGRVAESQDGPLVSGMREKNASLVGGDRNQTEGKLPVGKREALEGSLRCPPFTCSVIYLLIHPLFIPSLSVRHLICLPNLSAYRLLLLLHKKYLDLLINCK